MQKSGINWVLKFKDSTSRVRYDSPSLESVKIAIVEPSIQTRETAFEKRRGVNSVELQSGFAQVHISRLVEPIQENRLLALRQLKEEGVCLFFLKLTPSGLSFLVREENVQKLNQRFQELDFTFSLNSGKSVVVVNAVNMRDEEGLLASILSQAIASGARIEHLGDMHDALCIAAIHEDAQKIADAIRSKEFGQG